MSSTVVPIHLATLCDWSSLLMPLVLPHLTDHLRDRDTESVWHCYFEASLSPHISVLTVLLCSGSGWVLLFLLSFKGTEALAICVIFVFSRVLQLQMKRSFCILALLVMQAPLRS